MGCDIHLRVQARRDGVWHDVTDEAIADDDGSDDRNYYVFAFLADVRNGSGVRDSHGDKLYEFERIEPQFAFRGLPEGVEEFERDKPWLGEHGHTWATLAEVRRAPWDVLVKDNMLVSPAAYFAWKREGKMPHSWCRGANSRIVTEDEVTEADLTGERWTHIAMRVEWPALANCGFRQWMNRLDHERFGAATPDDVRVVMGFDS